MQYSGKIFVCPFFKQDGDLEIRCEGKSRNNSTLIFKDKEQWDFFTDNFCSNLEHYEECSIAKALLNYYERIDK